MPDNVVPVRRTRKAAEARPAEPSSTEPDAAPAKAVPRRRTRTAPEVVAQLPPEAPQARRPARPASDAAALTTARPRRTAKIALAGVLPPASIPPGLLKTVRNVSLLGWAIGISVAFHLVVLSIHFAPVVMKDLGRGPPIEVALVNAKTKEKPVKADVLAQANLDGGGNTDADRRAKSPLPVLPKDSEQNEISVATRKVQELERQAQELLAQMKARQAVPVAPKAPDADTAPELPTSNELMQKTLEAMRLEAQIAKDMDAYQKRPKRRFVGARAEEYRFARYVEDWRLKVEDVGNRNYPEAARKGKLYGSVVLTVSIRADGTLENVEVSEGSGKRILDAAAVKIVEMARPFAAFPPEIKRDTDILSITRTFSFTKGNELVSQ